MSDPTPRYVTGNKGSCDICEKPIRGDAGAVVYGAYRKSIDDECSTQIVAALQAAGKV